jgi:hypothetical protein
MTRLPALLVAALVVTGCDPLMTLTGSSPVVVGHPPTDPAMLATVPVPPLQTVASMEAARSKAAMLETWADVLAASRPKPSPEGKESGSGP